jgi:murein DD-endopeptidase MepM/ murein hydrolase activator NlpD
MRTSKHSSLIILVALILLAGCVQPAPATHPWMLYTATIPPASLSAQNIQVLIPTQRPADSVYLTPTPDAPHSLPAIQISDPAGLRSSEFKIIPDSELVYGPVSATFDTASFIQQQGGYLSGFSEDIDGYGTVMSGTEMVKELSYEYSVNPRLLLAVLEYQSGWVTQSQPPDNLVKYPMGLVDDTRAGLYRQLSWAANQLNYGYYLWKVGGLSSVQLADNSFVSFPATLNAGTVAVQRFFALVNGADGWSAAVSEGGVYATYTRMFGIPFDYSVDNLVPSNLAQPKMQLPFEKGDTWSFTGGPHAAWGDGAAWAALDFAPPADIFGCFQTNVWEVAVTDGVIVRSGNGEVVLDLDGDGLEQTGWTVLYMHVESRDRITAGTRVKTGDRIGHPSCEGGYSTATHLHLARRYNGEWIAADGSIPFNLEGWVSQGSGVQYNGTLIHGGKTVVAEDGRIAENQIER